MKAIVYNKYGISDDLEFKDIDKPIPGDNEVLIKVHSASINSWDLDLIEGKEFLTRLSAPPRYAGYRILGCDVAGTIEAAGKKVDKFNIGDEVFGDISAAGWGAFADYVSVKEDALSLKPSSMTFEEAACFPQSAVLALQGLRDKGKIQSGQKVLINGAGGCVGPFAIQLAKLFGAEVTGVDNATKQDFMRSVGADHVIDYTKEDFTKNGKHYDLILDNFAYRSVSDYKRALNPKGNLVMVGGNNARIFRTAFLSPFVSIRTGQKMGVLMHKANKGLDYIIELFNKGKIKPYIDKSYSLSDTVEAFRYFSSEKFLGKVVIKVR